MILVIIVSVPLTCRFRSTDWISKWCYLSVIISVDLLSSLLVRWDVNLLVGHVATSTRMVSLMSFSLLPNCLLVCLGKLSLPTFPVPGWNIIRNRMWSADWNSNSCLNIKNPYSVLKKIQWQIPFGFIHMGNCLSKMLICSNVYTSYRNQSIQVNLLLQWKTANLRLWFCDQLRQSNSLLLKVRDFIPVFLEAICSHLLYCSACVIC